MDWARDLGMGLVYTTVGLVLLACGALGAGVAALWGVETIIASQAPESLASFRSVLDTLTGDWQRVRRLGLLGGVLFTCALAYDFGRSVLG